MKEKKSWPLNMTQASHIAHYPKDAASDLQLAKYYNVEEKLIHEIRSDKSYNGVNLG